MWDCFIYLLTEVPGVAGGIFLKLNIKGKKYFDFWKKKKFGLVEPQGTQGFPQKMSAHSASYS